MALRFGLVSMCAALWLGVATGCIDSHVTECASGRICPAGTVCDVARDGCVLPAQLANCDAQPDLATCSYPGVTDGACYDGVCLPAGCGNGITDPDEACDDGNRVHGDGCAADCRSDESCGNDVTDLPVGESCDDGNNEDGDGCRANCVAISCGDGIKDAEAFEQCDEGSGNSDAPNATCRLNCQEQRCGDGIIDPDPVDPEKAEECDDGNEVPGDGCAGTCLTEWCGNGVVDLEPQGPGFVPTEECDDGNDLSLDGCSPSCEFVGGTWERNATPQQRNTHAMAYDAARARVVMFGGFDSSYVGDTWEWDGRGWIELTPADAADSPSARGNHAMVYDAARSRTVLFGGFGTDHQADTYEWDGSSWTERTPAAATDSPSRRSLHAMAYDGARARVIVFGGLGAGTLGDTWEWDGSVWRDVTPFGSTASPAPRHGHAMVYDPSRGRTVLFGGFSGGQVSDTWEWNGTVWTDVTPVGPNNSPAPRNTHKMVYDAARRRVVLYGGNAAGIGTASDTWEWDGATWTEMTPANAADSPPHRDRHGLAYDTSRDRTVMFGGSAISMAFDTWEWDGTVWTDRTAAARVAPSPRSSHAATYNSRRGELVLFGGFGATRMSDTWVWTGRRWTDATPPSPSDSPQPLSRHSMAYDPTRQVVVLFGGVTPSFSDATWEWNGTRWSNVTPSTGSPSPRYYSSMVYDPARGQLILFGGFDGQYRGDTWTWNGTNWSDLTPTAADDSPSPRFRHAMTYDSRRERAIVFGGSDGALLRDTWTWDGSRWTAVTPPAGGDSPPARIGHALTYDAVLGRTILFGGTDGIRDFPDTWEWDGVRWFRVASAAEQDSPSARLGPTLTYDAARGRTILFGGHDGTDYMDETWRYAHRAAGPQSCHTGLDDDGDGAVSCADADCWGYCTPLCPPGTTCDPTAPRCGDGECNAALESCRSCGADCGTCNAVCGDFICEGAETALTCPGDC